MSIGHFEVTRLADSVFIRVIGHGNMNNSLALKDLGDRAHRDGVSRFTLDLRSCTGMDSTFMGTIMSFALMTASDAQGQGGNGVLIINVSPDLHDLLDGLGLTKFIRVRENMPVPVDLEFLEVAALEHRDVSGPERVRFIKEMHENLSRIDERNRVRFGPFIKALSQEFGA